MIELKPIPNFEGYYCSKEGDVYSAFGRGYYARIMGDSRYKMKPLKKRGGYLALHICGKYPTVHRLILAAWVGPANGLVCNHKNGIRDDNRLENLEWISGLENERHARNVLGKKLHGNYHPLAKTNPEEIFEMRKLRKEGWTYQKLADKYKLGISHVHRLVNGYVWKHLG